MCGGRSGARSARARLLLLGPLLVGCLPRFRGPSPNVRWLERPVGGRAAVARRYMSADSIAKALAPPEPPPEEVIAIEAAA
jgi:hypothetical protein